MRPSSRYLFERVSWYCRDHRTHRDAGDGTARIIFSNRSGMSYGEMREYFTSLEAQSGMFNVGIAWSVVKPDQIVAYPPAERMGLQLADAVAGSFFYAVEPSAHGFTEDRYARMLKPVVYHSQERYLGYGIKLWPRETDALVAEGGRFAWIRDAYM